MATIIKRDSKQMNGMKPVIAVLFVLAIGLQYKLWFDEGSIFDVLKNREEYKIQQANFDNLLDINHKLSNEIHALKAGGDILEEKAREDLGMIKEGETYYQIVEE